MCTEVAIGEFSSRRPFMIFQRLAVVALLALSAHSAAADSLPPELRATGKPETVLAGIDLTKTTIDEVFRRHGQPTREITAPNNRTFRGLIWEKTGWKLEVGTHRTPKGLVQIRDVYVEGIQPTVGTGQGLRLGDDSVAIARFYGTRSKTEKGSRSDPAHTAFGGLSTGQRTYFEWTPLNYKLTVGVTYGKVSAMWLTAPIGPIE